MGSAGGALALAFPSVVPIFGKQAKQTSKAFKKGTDMERNLRSSTFNGVAFACGHNQWNGVKIWYQSQHPDKTGS